MELQAALAVAKAQREFPLDALTWTSSQDLVAVAKGNAAVQSFEVQAFQAIPVDQAFRDLVQCGGLLQVALTAAGRQPCSTPILGIMSSYQDVLGDCVDASGSFVDACVAALKTHKLVKRALDKKNSALAFKMYAKCAELANKMAEVAGELVVKVDRLTNQATDALLAAQNDSTVNEKAKKEAEKLLRDLKAEQANLNSKLDSLATELEEVRQEEAKLMAQAAEQREKAFALAMTSAVISGVTSLVGNVATLGIPAVVRGLAGGAAGAAGAAGSPSADGGRPTGSPSSASSLADQVREAKGHVEGLRARLQELQADAARSQSEDGRREIEALKKEMKEAQQSSAAAASAAAAQCTGYAESLEAKEAAATARKRQLNDIKREQTSRLKQAVAEMEGMTQHKTQIEQTLLCLSVTVQTMGRVKTTFSNVKLFWSAVAKQCKTLAEMDKTLSDAWELADDLVKDEDPFSALEDSFMESAVRWAALGSVNHKAHRQMVDVKKSIDDKMCALPDGRACAAEVSRLARELKLSLEE